MHSTRPATSKRANPPRSVDYTKAFKKDWQQLTRSGRYDMRRLKEVMLLLIADDGPLGPEWSDHALVGPWEGYRECHAGGDFLLIYRLTEDAAGKRVILTRAGTHASLFE